VVGVWRLAVLGQGAGAKPTLLCTNELGFLVLLDGQGKPVGQIRAANRTINWIVAADLGTQNKTALCALGLVEPFTQVALGLGPNGEELWSYPLPKGVFERAPEQVVAGRLFLDGPGQWILPGADGSIHVLGPDGKLIDRFNYGASLSGLATTVIDNRPVLVVATKDSVEAWKVQVPAPDKR